MEKPLTPPGSLHVTAEAAEGGERLDRLLARRFANLSRTRLKRLVEAGQVTLAGATITDPSLRVKAGQSFAVAIPAPLDDKPAAQAIALDILFEDSDVIVLDKPAGLVVHPAPGNPDRTLVNALLAHCGDSLSGIGGVRRPGIVHRLDKDTSGVMVVAKSEMAHAALTADFAARRITRAYEAVVWGVPAEPRGEIEAAIGRDPRNRKRMAIVRRGGRTALTRYELLRNFSDAASLVACRLATGRTHQIRVHLSARGHPLIGDRTYGAQRPATRLPVAARARLEAFPRQALHAKLIGFRHPRSGELLQFETSLPRDMAELVVFLDSL